MQRGKILLHRIILVFINFQYIKAHQNIEYRKKLTERRMFLYCNRKLDLMLKRRDRGLIVKISLFYVLIEVENFRVTKLSYETELRKTTSYFGSLTRKCFQKFFFRVTNSTLYNVKLNFELLTRSINFYFFTFELITRSAKIKNYTLCY